MNLSVLGNVSASSSSDYSARGVVGLSGAAMYDSFSKFAAAAGVPCSVIAQPTLVAENLLLSYLSGTYCAPVQRGHLELTACQQVRS